MSTWAIVPLKRLEEAKSSLSSALSQKERRDLVLCMFADVLNAIRSATLIEGTIVVSPDEEVLKFASENGAMGVLEPGLELNDALKLAIRRTIEGGASSVLILPSDLPLLRPADIENIIAMASSPKEVVLSPSKANGTNALFLRPPDVMSLRFGGESFPAHLAEARRSGIIPKIYRSASTATDIDDVASLSIVEALGMGTRTHEFLRSLGRFSEGGC